MANQGRGELLRQFLQWRRQQGGGGAGQFGGGGQRFGFLQGSMGGAGRLAGRVQGGTGRGQFGQGPGRFGRFQGGMGQEQGEDDGPLSQFTPDDIAGLDPAQRVNYRQRLQIRLDWLEKRIAQTMTALEELDALEAAEAESEQTEAEVTEFATASREVEAKKDETGTP
jgi:hypothetical protein